MTKSFRLRLLGMISTPYRLVDWKKERAPQPRTHLVCGADSQSVKVWHRQIACEQSAAMLGADDLAGLVAGEVQSAEGLGAGGAEDQVLLVHGELDELVHKIAVVHQIAVVAGAVGEAGKGGESLRRGVLGVKGRLGDRLLTVGTADEGEGRGGLHAKRLDLAVHGHHE